MPEQSLVALSLIPLQLPGDLEGLYLETFFPLLLTSYSFSLVSRKK